MKKSAIERAIDQLDSEIAVLQLAKARLLSQQHKSAPVRRPRPVVKIKEIETA